MTQKERVLARLRAGHDVSPTDFQLPNVVDGGKPILRVAARILELRQDGYQIDVVATRNECAVYRLQTAGHDEILPRVYCERCGQEGALRDTGCESCVELAHAQQEADEFFSRYEAEAA